MAGELQKHIGPLEVWQWGAVGAVIAGGVVWYLRKNGGGAQTIQTAPIMGNIAGAGDGSGDIGTNGASSPNQPPVFTGPPPPIGGTFVLGKPNSGVDRVGGSDFGWFGPPNKQQQVIEWFGPPPGNGKTP